MRRWQFSLVPFVLCGLALLSSAPVAASTPPRWGEPTPLYQALPSSWFPDIQADPNGTFRLVWNGNLTAEDGNATHSISGAVLFSQLTAGGWSQPSDIYVMDAGIASRPLIASDGQYAHLLFRTGTLGIVRLVYMRAPLGADLSNANSWSQPQTISNDESYYGQIMTLPDGGLLVLYNVSYENATATAPDASTVTPPPATPTRPSASSTSAGTPTPITKRRTTIFARRSDDQGQTWGFPIRVSDTAERVGRTALALSPDGSSLIAAWDEGYDNLTGQGDPLGAGTARSRDGGRTWRADPAIRSPRGPIEQASVAIGSDGPLLVYRSTTEDRLFYRTAPDAGGAWSDERQVPDVVARPYSSKHNFDKLGLARDGDGRLILSYIGADASAPKGLGVMVTTFAAGIWTPPILVAAPDGYPEYPRIAVARGNQLQLAYFVRDNEFDIGHYILYTVTGESDARMTIPNSPVVPAQAPTSTPQPPTSAIQLQIAPTRLPIPAQVIGEQGEIREPQDEVNRPALTPLLITLVALGVIGMVVGVLRRI